MQEASGLLAESGAAPGMAAVLGLDGEQVDDLLAQWKLEDLYAANYNSRRQVVVSGSAAALALAEKRFKEAGARRVLALKVAGPFHSPLMAGAAERFAPFLARVSFNDPRIPFYSNVTGKAAATGAGIRELALTQITAPVRWISEEESIAASGVDILLETGPGKTLQGLWKETGSPLPCLGAGSAEEIERLEAKSSLPENKGDTQ
jgi:[acyl-carrier-protein] S-malonyltransferase